MAEDNGTWVPWNGQMASVESVLVAAGMTGDDEINTAVRAAIALAAAYDEEADRG